MGNKIPFNKIHNFIVYEIIDENGNLLNNFDLPLLEWAKVNNYSYTSLDKLRKGNLDIQLPYKNWKLKKLYVKRKHFQRDDSYLYILFDLTKQINKEEGTKASELAGRLKLLASVLGILEQDPNTFLTSGANNDDNAEIEALVKERNDARKAKDWARADAARDKLKAMHIELEDTPQGTVWHRV